MKYKRGKMKILSINDYNSLVGGTEIGTQSLNEELLKKKNSIVYQGCGSGNYKWDTYWLPLIEGTEDLHKTGILDKIKSGKRWMFYEHAYDYTREIILKEKPDLAHVHNLFYQLSVDPLVALN